KGFLTALVVAGHVMSYPSEASPAWQPAWAIIYAFHMPAFVFLSGYLTSRSKGILEAVREILGLYVVAQAAWFVLLVITTWPFDLSNVLALALQMATDPGYGLWYLLALFYWRSLAPVWALTRSPRSSMITLIALGMLAGAMPGLGLS